MRQLRESSGESECECPRNIAVASCEKSKLYTRLAIIFSVLIVVIYEIFSLYSIAFGNDPFLAGGNRAAQDVQKTYLRQNDFYIPYKLNDESDAQAPLNLYCSKNLGRSWELFKSLIPANEPNGARQFNIRVDADGEYWFIILPSRIENSPNPNLGYRPHLRIVVDTMAPILKIETQKTDNDKITIFWTMTDRNPSVDSVRFFQRYSETADWSEINLNSKSVVLFNNPDGASGATGQFTVQVSHGVYQLFIKGEAYDKAKIPTVTLWTVSMTGTNVVLPGTAVQQGVGTDALGRGEFKSAFLNPETGSASPSSAENSPTPITPGGSIGWSANRPGTPNPARGERSILSPRTVVSSLKVINKPHFDLDYDITAVGHSGVGAVEVWATRNHGTDWFQLAKDNDNITPVAIDLTEDGIYGLKLVLENGAGIRGGRPRPGETPSSWLVLDRTAPTGELTSAEIRVDSNIPQMRLRWGCTDEYPSQTPVALYWSRDGQEPWSLIADQLPAVGDYLWTMPNDVPARIVIKMEMQDRAGNISTHISRPIAADAFVPQGYIRGIHTTE